MPMPKTMSKEPQRMTRAMNSKIIEGNAGQQHDLSDHPKRYRHSTPEMQQTRQYPIETSKYWVAQSWCSLECWKSDWRWTALLALVCVINLNGWLRAHSYINLPGCWIDAHVGLYSEALTSSFFLLSPRWLRVSMIATTMNRQSQMTFVWRNVSEIMPTRPARLYLFFFTSR